MSGYFPQYTTITTSNNQNLNCPVKAVSVRHEITL
jgi:hypothetical protein